MPSDVRKASGFSGGRAIWISGYAQFVGAEPRIHYQPKRKRGALPHIRRHSRAARFTFRQKP
ncbi:MAG TPA: hypothetical protein DC054_03535 [Blastocatellia bacterium]|nr:hypothetical protein [Blastocatellia bacterium]